VDIVSKLELKGKFGDVAPGQIADVTYHKGFAYLAGFYRTDDDGNRLCDRSGVYIVDVRDPAAPKEVGFIPVNANSYVGEGQQVIEMNTAFFKGDLLTFNNEACDTDAPGGRGISLVDVSNPANPVVLASEAADNTTGKRDGPAVTAPEDLHRVHSAFSWQEGANAYSVAVDDDDGNDSDVDIYDITNPANPVIINEIGANDFPGVDGTAYGNATFFHDVQIKRIDGRQIMLLSYWDRGWFKLDVTDPRNPTQVDPDFDYVGEDPFAPGFSREGNGHQAWFSRTNEFIVSTDEDFNPYRFDARITAGPNQDDPLTATQGSGVPQVGPGNPLEGDTRFVGEACTPGSVAPSAGIPIAVVARGTCTFQEKYDSVVAAGYDAGLVFNSNSTNSGCEALLNMLVDGDDIPFLFLPRNQGLRVIDAFDEATYECTPGDPSNTTPNPAAPRDGSPVRFVAQFDGWGYVHLLDAKSMSELDTFAIPEAHDERYSQILDDGSFGFGDLTVHEVKTDELADLAYTSYYAGGFRVLSFNRTAGLQEVGHSIDQGGNNLWGVFPITAPNGERLILASDRDFGLYVYRYTGPGAIGPRPVTPASTPTTPKPGRCTNLLAVTAGKALVGSEFGEQITGTEGADTVDSKAGDDCIDGLGGNDNLRGGKGVDTIDGQKGNDRVRGDSGRGNLRGGTGNDRVTGGSGKDTLFGNTGRDRLSGGRGNDALFGGSGNDRITGGKGKNVIEGGTGNDRIFAKNGRTDRIDCGFGKDNVVSRDRSDKLTSCEKKAPLRKKKSKK